MAQRMYTVHPNDHALSVTIPVRLAEASSNVHRLQYDDLRGMRDMVFRLADLVQSLRPNLVPFFATGSIPYVVPTMYRLCDLGDYKYLNGSVFHMFPGLVWDSKTLQATGADIFKGAFAQLLTDQAPNRILCIDTTGVGNAVNNAVKALLEVCGSTGRAVAIFIVGIVNKPMAVPGVGREAIMSRAEPLAHVLMPSGLQHVTPMQNGEFQEFTGVQIPKNITLQIAYWVASEILTEDQSDLIGAFALRNELRVGGVATPGRIQIVSPNGECPQQTGLDSISTRMLNLLSKDDNSPFWKWAAESAALPPANAETLAFREEVQWFSDGMIEYFELHNDPKAVETIEKGNGTLSGPEILLLLTRNEIRDPFIGRIRHSLRTVDANDWRTIDLLSDYLRRAFPSNAEAEPKNMSSGEKRTWWLTRI